MNRISGNDRKCRAGLIRSLLLLLLSVPAAGSGWPELRGDYLGQEPPGREPQVFAAGILKPENGFHSSVVFNTRGNEAYWTSMGARTFISRCVDGLWSAPEILDCDPEFGMGEPMLTADDRRLFFLSRRPLPNDPVVRERIWHVERHQTAWVNPRVIDEAVSAHPTHWQFSFTAGGDLYFTSEISGVRGKQDIYVSRWRGDSFTPPRSAGDRVNTDVREFCPFVAPDESYLIFARSVPEKRGRSDLFVTFRTEEGNWGEAVNLGEAVNSLHNEMCPVVTADGRYLFFLRGSQEINDVFWVDAEILESIRTQP